MIHGPISLYFNPLYITSIDVTNTPVVGIPYTFQMQVTAAESTSIIPDIITTLSVNTSV